VLLVLALIGLLSAVLIGGGAQLLNRKPMSADEIFWASVQEARKTALKQEADVTLKFVDDKDRGKTFVITGAEGAKTMPVPNPGDLEVTFLSAQKGGNMIMIAGTVIETTKMESVTFYADGTCTPFRVQFFRNGATHTTAVDPWTCAPVLTAADASGARPNS
jgi:general secretion pathway protein H